MADSDVELREMQALEIDVVCELIADAMNTDEARWARETFAFHFKSREHGLDDGRAYFTYRTRQGLLALAGLHHYAWGPPENVWLAWFAVHPTVQRQGIGRGLLAMMEELAKNRGYRKLFIETYDHPDFAKARCFYAACGFSQAGQVARYLPDGHDMLVYLKSLA